MPGVYAGFADAIALGGIMQKGLTIRTGQTHVQKYIPKLLDMILENRIDTTFLISHRMSLRQDLWRCRQRPFPVFPSEERIRRARAPRCLPQLASYPSLPMLVWTIIRPAVGMCKR